MTITEGFLTYDAEGMEGGPYHSRVLHVPSATSGLTIGRGYDMKEKSSEKIMGDLTAAGVEPAGANLIAQASGLSGDEAKQFVADNGLADFEISMEGQESLFRETYAEMAKDVKRICDKADCVAAYGEVDWDNLDSKIKDVMIDLRYRGDYTPASRRRIQALVANNDLDGFIDVMTDQEQWSQVPQDRFQRRCDFVQS